MPTQLGVYLAKLDKAVRALADARSRGGLNPLDASYLALLVAEKENVVDAASAEGGQLFLASNAGAYALACEVAGSGRRCSRTTPGLAKKGKKKARQKKCGRVINGPQVVCTKCQQDANPALARIVDKAMIAAVDKTAGRKPTLKRKAMSIQAANGVRAKWAKIGLSDGKGKDVAAVALVELMERKITKKQVPKQLKMLPWLCSEEGWTLVVQRGSLEYTRIHNKKREKATFVQGARMAAQTINRLLLANPETVAVRAVLPSEPRRATRSTTTQGAQLAAMYSYRLVNGLVSAALVCGLPGCINMAAICETLSQCSPQDRVTFEASLASLLTKLAAKPVPSIEAVMYALPIAVIALHDAAIGFKEFQAVPCITAPTPVRGVWVEVLTRLAGAVQLLAKHTANTPESVQLRVEALVAAHWPVGHPRSTVTEEAMQQSRQQKFYVTEDTGGALEVFVTDDGRGEGVRVVKSTPKGRAS